MSEGMFWRPYTHALADGYRVDVLYRTGRKVEDLYSKYVDWEQVAAYAVITEPPAKGVEFWAVEVQGQWCQCDMRVNCAKMFREVTE